jgi:hypothetical protein
VSKLAATVQRFPDRELEIRRLCARDPDFLTVCEDLDDALKACGHWQTMGARAAGRAEEYRVFAEELAAEILSALNAEQRGKRVPGG